MSELVTIVNLGEQGIQSADGEKDKVFMPDVPMAVLPETADRLLKKFNNPDMAVYFEKSDITNTIPVIKKKRGRKAKGAK